MLLVGFDSDKVSSYPVLQKHRYSKLTPPQRGERYLHIALPLTITVVANIIAVSSLNIAARCKSFMWFHYKCVPSSLHSADVAMMLMPASFYSSSIVQLSWISSSLSQPAVKRAASIALINCICNTPNSMSPFYPPLNQVFLLTMIHVCSLDSISLLRLSALCSSFRSQSWRSGCCYWNGDCDVCVSEEAEQEVGNGERNGKEWTYVEAAGCWV